MNRKNLTAAVLAGLAGAAGLAGTAQAVNLNPDGLGQVLIYPYYTSNAGNDTLLSVVNTTDSAKAVKVRFKEGYNSREVLDFNLYMSAYDVWVAAITDDAGTPTLLIPDSSCTVPYFYGLSGDGMGVQPFLPYDYSSDGGPTDIARAAEGHFEMIEMGTLTNESENLTAKDFRLGSADAATHVIDDETGEQAPEDCQQLVDNWSTGGSNGGTGKNGMWIENPKTPEVDRNIDIARNSGGLFGGAAIINVGNGTMFSYDAKAVQGFDKSVNGNHYICHAGDPNKQCALPDLNSGDQNTATVFFGAPKDEAVTLTSYLFPVDAVSAVFMHEYTMNEYSIEAGLHAASEWVITFPTKNYYVDTDVVGTTETWIPDVDDTGCGGWKPGDDFPAWSPVGDQDGSWAGDFPNPKDPNWTQCTYVKIEESNAGRAPFTSTWSGKACEPADIVIWDREENAGGGTNGRPPIVSPAPPGSTGSSVFEICYETNILRFGNDGVYNPVFGTSSALLLEVDTGAILYDNNTMELPRDSGWARINWGDPQVDKGVFLGYGHQDFNGLVGLPVTGFWAEQFTNGYMGTPEASVLANYGGLFQHKGSVKRVAPEFADSSDG